jgi:hypothetical protein
MTIVEIQLLANLLERAQHVFSPVEIFWVNVLLDRERQKAELETQVERKPTEGDLPTV